jgi:molybdopterin-synthase adenylyltransferase
MEDEELLRYSRHIMLPQVGIDGQQRLLQSRVLIVGLGGLGSPVAMYLTASGVGELVIADYDNVELSNLQRQIVHGTAALGMEKSESATRTLNALNPQVRITPLHKKLNEQELIELVRSADAVVDASDNFATRFALNRACVREKTPLISGAVIRFEGQVSVFHSKLGDSPCYNCLYRETEELGERCSETGILAPVAGIIGTIQATETLKVLLGVGESLAGRLLILDALTMSFREIRLRRDAQCPTCGAGDTPRVSAPAGG